jgi:hypothetical protein
MVACDYEETGVLSPLAGVSKLFPLFLTLHDIFDIHNTNTRITFEASINWQKILFYSLLVRPDKRESNDNNRKEKKKVRCPSQPLLFTTPEE